MKVRLSVDELESRDVPSIFTSVPSSKGTLVQEWDETGYIIRTIDPFPGFKGELHLASGRSEHEVIIGAGEGGGPHVKRYDSLGLKDSFFAYAPIFFGGVNVSAGTTDGEIITGPGRGGAPHVRVFHDGKLTKEWYAGNPNDLTGVIVAGSGVGNGVFPSFSSHPIGVEKSIYVEFLPGTDPSVITKVAELYAAYKVNVTNVRPVEPVTNVSHVIVGTNFPNLNGSQKGVAVVGGLFDQDEFTERPAYVETLGLTPEQVTIAIAHEAGHLVGLEHNPNIASIMNPAIQVNSHFVADDDLTLSFRYGRY